MVSFPETCVAFDWEIRIRISDLQSKAKSENGLHREIRPDFMDFLLYRSIEKSAKGFVKLFS